MLTAHTCRKENHYFILLQQQQLLSSASVPSHHPLTEYRASCMPMYPVLFTQMAHMHMLYVGLCTSHAVTTINSPE